jgi:hypothetical protein
MLLLETGMKEEVRSASGSRMPGFHALFLCPEHQPLPTYFPHLYYTLLVGIPGPMSFIFLNWDPVHHTFLCINELSLTEQYALDLLEVCADHFFV